MSPWVFRKQSERERERDSEVSERAKEIEGEGGASEDGKKEGMRDRLVFKTRAALSTVMQ